MKNKEVDFIARRYKKGRFSPDAGWQRMGIAPISIWRRYRVAAAVAATVILSATATVLYREYRMDDEPKQAAPVVTVNPLEVVKVIDFEETPLPEVIKKIESIYNVKIDNIPDNPEDYELSLHYEGTPADLISVINDILETQMTVAEK
jgi:hypothetical protein